MEETPILLFANSVTKIGENIYEARKTIIIIIFTITFKQLCSYQ